MKEMKDVALVSAGQGTTQQNSDVNDQNLNMENEKEGLTVGYDSPNSVDHNGGPVKCHDIGNNVVESSEVVQSESVAVAIP